MENEYDITDALFLMQAALNGLDQARSPCEIRILVNAAISHLVNVAGNGLNFEHGRGRENAIWLH